MSNNREQVFIKVDVDKALREKKKLPKDQFGKEVTYSRAVLNNKNWQYEMGKKGLMRKDDYENRPFAAYGLDKERVTGHGQVKALEEANTDLQKQIAALEAQLAEKTTKKKDKPTE